MATIHMDPVVTTDEHVDALKAQCIDILADISEVLSLHDFRVAFGETHTNLIFDLVIPHRFEMSDGETIRLIQKNIKSKIGENYFAVINVDNPTI